MEKEECKLCGEETGRAGRHEDSIYLASFTPAQIGPLCETCYNTIVCDVEADYAHKKSEVKRLEKALADTERMWREERDKNLNGHGVI